MTLRPADLVTASEEPRDGRGAGPTLGLRFTRWQRLAEAAAAAPHEPGVVQVRAPGLLPYPRGTSAMLLYASSENQTLASFLTFCQGRWAGQPELHQGWVRFAAAADPDAAVARLLFRFTDRFGALPRGHAWLPEDAADPAD